MRKVTIEATNIRKSIYDKWEGNGSFKRYANTKAVKQSIIEKLNNIIKSENITSYDVKLNDYVIVIHFTDTTTKQELNNITNHKLISQNIFAYHNMA